MGRRRGRGPDLAILEAIAGLVAICLFFGGRHSDISAFAVCLFWLSIFCVVAVAGVFFFRLNLRQTREAAAASIDPIHFKAAAVTSEPSETRRNEFRPGGSVNLKDIDWFQFEKLVELAFSRTHRVIRRGGANPDGGIDLIIENFNERLAVQCKHWNAWKVGVKVVRELMGAMSDAGFKSGAIVTVNGFSADAVDLAQRHGIRLIDEMEFRALLAKVNPSSISAIVNDQRKYCPKCGSEMVLRAAQRGKNVGSRFWGCSRYPACKFTLNYETGGVRTGGVPGML